MYLLEAVATDCENDELIQSVEDAISQKFRDFFKSYSGVQKAWESEVQKTGESEELQKSDIAKLMQGILVTKAVEESKLRDLCVSCERHLASGSIPLHNMIRAELKKRDLEVLERLKSQLEQGKTDDGTTCDKKMMQLVEDAINEDSDSRLMLHDSAGYAIKHMIKFKKVADALPEADAENASKIYLACIDVLVKHYNEKYRRLLVNLYNDLGRAFVRQKEWGQAVAPLTKSLDLDSDNAKAFYLRASCMYKLCLGDWDWDLWNRGYEDVEKAQAKAYEQTEMKQKNTAKISELKQNLENLCHSKPDCLSWLQNQQKSDNI